MPSRPFSLRGKTLTLDARPDRLDLRDRPYLPPTRSLPTQFPDAQTLSKYLASYVKSRLILDQGNEGACTGFGLAAVINYLLWTRALQEKKTRGFRAISPFMLYDLAQFYDEWPGEDYEGSSCRGAMKGWHKHGVCDSSFWKYSVRRKAKKPYKPGSRWAPDAATRPVGVYYRVNHESVVDMQAAILNMGAIYVSCDVHKGWDIAGKSRQRKVTHASLPVIQYRADAKIGGGHALALVGYNEKGFIVQNSWGAGWGSSGFAILSYADWVANGADAWVCALGVPQVEHLTAATVIGGTRTRQLGASLLSGDSEVAGKGPAASVPAWDADRAYQHTVVAGNNGQVRMSLPDIGTPAGLVEHIVKDNLGKWLAATGKSARKVVIYAHGGLNSEEDSIKRIRVLAPYFLENGIYPLFYTWRTGVWEIIASKLQDSLGIGPAEMISTGFFSDARDYLLESVAHAAQWIWNEMKDNAQGAMQANRALALIAANLKQLQDTHAGTEFHLVGHSAGSFVNGYMLDLMARTGITPASLTWLAPACSLEFADNHLTSTQLVPPNKIWLHMLDDAREKQDTAGPYGKSLLYLVCRGFENVRKTPLAGLQHCIDTKATEQDDDLWTPGYWAAVGKWRKWVNGLPAQADGRPACEIVTADHVYNGKKYLPSSHGSFDNNKEVIERTINRILGNKPNATPAVPVDDLGE